MQMLEKLSKITSNCENVIYSNFEICKKESKVRTALITHLSKRPDFSSLIKVVKAYDGKSKKTKKRRASLAKEETELKYKDTPYQIFKDNLKSEKSKMKTDLMEAKKNALANDNGGGSSSATKDVHDAWLLVDERNSLNCRDNYVCDLDKFCDLCLNAYNDLRDEMRKVLWGNFQTYNSKRTPTFDDFSILVFQADPRMSEATVADMLEFALDETKKSRRNENNNTGDDDVENVNLQSFLKAAAKYNLFACNCRTFGTRVGTGLEAEKARLSYEKFLTKVKILDTLDVRQRYKVAGAFIKNTYDKGARIIKQGDRGNEFFIILRGKVSVEKEEPDGSRKFLINLESGDFFGEQALLSNERRNATCIAKTDTVTCLTLKRSAFDDLLGPLEHIMKRSLSEFQSIFEEWRAIEEPFNEYVEAVRIDMRSSVVKKLQLGVKLKQLVDAKETLLGYLHDRVDANAARRAYHRLIQMHPDREKLLSKQLGLEDDEEEDDNAS